MKAKKHKIIATLLLFFLIALIPLGEAAPLGASELATVNAAKSWIGVKEVHGGNSSMGIDCSHFVYQVYKQVGVKGIEFQTVPNMTKNAQYITTTSPNPGDVIFWKKDIIENGTKYWLTYHVGIYIGNGQFIHASDETKNVTTDSISGMYKEGLPYYARWYPKTDENSNSPQMLYNDIWGKIKLILDLIYLKSKIGS